MEAYLQTYQITDSQMNKRTHILFVDYDGESFLLCKSPIPEIGNIQKGNHQYILEEGEADDMILDLATDKVENDTNYCSKCVGTLYTEDNE